MTKRHFIKNIDAKDVNNEIVNDLHSGAVSLYVINNATEKTIELFGTLLDQDMYGRKSVTIGYDDNHGMRLNHATDMLWHQDRAYSKDIHPFVGLYCVRADEGSSPTHYLDMQNVYKDSSDELKEATKDIECVNSITKYMSQEEYPYQFKNEVQKRAWRMKNRATHPLVWEDSYGPFYFYSEAYTETDLEPQLKQEIYKQEHMYSHYWKQHQLLVYNNYKTLHKRDTTEEKVVRQHVRFALDKF